MKGGERVTATYTFAARRKAGDGMAGFSLRGDVMYLIMPDRFADGNPNNDGPRATSARDSAEAAAERANPKGWHGGDLRGIDQHLDYIEALGATAVWPTPVYQNHGPEAYHGYHATDYYAVDEHYGTMAELQGLAQDLHARKMKLILDIVPNHVGPAHPWVNDEPAPDWFHGTLSDHVQAEYNFNALVDEHAPERDRLATLHGLVCEPAAGHEHGLAGGCAVPAAELRVVGGADGGGRLPDRHVLLCETGSSGMT